MPHKKEEMKMNKTILTSIAALAISVAFVSVGIAQQAPAAAPKSAAAQPAPAKANWEKVRGVIENVNEAAKEITVQTQKEKMAFSVGEQTKISEVTTKLPFSDLKKGMPVTVEYKKEGPKLLAEWIDVTKNVEAKTATPAQSKEVKKENPSGKAAEKK
jgi:Cu/Ag efflux protein CusF